MKSYNFSLFLWCYEYVLTRCYGWSVKYTSLIPFADLLNHNTSAVDHFFVDKNLENDKFLDPDYKMKKDKINLELIGVSNIKKEETSWRKNILEKLGVEYREDV